MKKTLLILLAALSVTGGANIAQASEQNCKIEICQPGWSYLFNRTFNFWSENTLDRDEEINRSADACLQEAIRNTKSYGRVRMKYGDGQTKSAYKFNNGKDSC